MVTEETQATAESNSEQSEQDNDFVDVGDLCEGLESEDYL